jgi:hypothetical protein
VTTPTPERPNLAGRLAAGEVIPAARAHADAPHTGTGFRVVYEPQHDSVYAILDDRTVDPDASRDLDADRTLDHAPDGVPVGVEFRRVSRGVVLDAVPQADRIAAELARLGITVRTAAPVP